MPLNSQRKIDLSPEARAALKLPLVADKGYLIDADGTSLSVVYTSWFGPTYNQSCEIAAFIAALVNEALTPAAPAALCEYDDCDQAALPGGDFCAIHQAEHDELMADAEPIGDLAEQYNEAIGAALAEQLGDPDTISPETTTELRQLITTELEAEQRWTAEDIMRREG